MGGKGMLGWEHWGKVPFHSPAVHTQDCAGAASVPMPESNKLGCGCSLCLSHAGRAINSSGVLQSKPALSKAAEFHFSRSCRWPVPLRIATQASLQSWGFLAWPSPRVDAGPGSQLVGVSTAQWDCVSSHQQWIWPNKPPRPSLRVPWHRTAPLLVNPPSKWFFWCASS